MFVHLAHGLEVVHLLLSVRWLLERQLLPFFVCQMKNTNRWSWSWSPLTQPYAAHVETILQEWHKALAGHASRKQVFERFGQVVDWEPAIPTIASYGM